VRFLKNPHFDFLGIKWYMIGVSIAVILIGTISLVAKGGPKLGIDFTGGAQLLYAFSSKPDENAIRKIVEGSGIKLEGVQRFDKPEKNQVLLRIRWSRKRGGTSPAR